METITHLPPTATLDTMSTPEPQQQFLKLEDLHNPATSSPAPSSYDGFHGSQASPPPSVITIQSRPAKKRKSWGQELPEPKTNLPPRKRAKTDDEKEQRRIERIKRNRAAAHNSRERKRQETETLAVALARANAELDAYRKLHGPLPASIVLPEVTLTNDDETPAPSLMESQSRASVGEPVSRPASPVDSLFKASPQAIKQEPLETSFPVSLAPAFDNLDAKSALSSSSSPLDLTQHSAAMLCDLQCRSSRVARSLSSSPALASWWTHLFLSLMAFQLQTCYKTLLVAIWTLSPSRMARCLTQASTRRSTSRSTTSSMTLQPLRSTHRRLALSCEQALPAAARTDLATGLRAPHRRGAATALLQQSDEQVLRTRSLQRPTERVSSPACLSAFGEKDHSCRDREADHHHCHQHRCDEVDQKDGVGHGQVS